MGGSDIRGGQILDRAIPLIERRHRIRLERYDIDIRGLTVPALRPSEPAGVSLFAITAQATPRGVLATLMPDIFAGNVIRVIGESAQADPQLWVQAVAHGSAGGIRTSIFVNDTLVAADHLPDTTWQNLEIECHAPISRYSDNDKHVEIVSGVVGHCLALSLLGLDTENFQDPAESAPEGAKMIATVNRYERSPRNRRACINHYGWSCWVCDLDFSEIYGPLGDGYIQVHHMVPVAEMGPGYRPDPVMEMVPLCSNCHSMIHRREPLLSPLELRELLGKDPKESPWDGQTPTR
jgi:5-methylcytosine-specific restriction protein A